LGRLDFSGAPASTESRGEPVHAPSPDSPGSEDALDAETDLRTALETFERRHIRHVLDQVGWRRGQAAEVLGINRKTLFKKIQSLGLDSDRNS
jgi:two-component system response regulator HydG/two-component system response regulator AtoC